MVLDRGVVGKKVGSVMGVCVMEVVGVCGVEGVDVTGVVAGGEVGGVPLEV